MLSRSSGKVLNIASTSAYQPGPLMAVYFASKSYVLSFSQALAEEMRGTGVSITALCPGPTVSNFAKQANLTDNPIHNGLPPLMTAQQVAEYGYKVLQQNKRVAIVGGYNKLFTYLSRLAPTHMVMRTIHKLHAK